MMQEKLRSCQIILANDEAKMLKKKHSSHSLYIFGLVIDIIIPTTRQGGFNMRRQLSLFLMILLVLSSLTPFTLPVFVEAAGEGLWKLVSVDTEQSAADASRTPSIAQGSGTLSVVSAETGDRFKASMSWSAPLQVYGSDDPVEITLMAKVDEYVWNGKNDGYIHPGLNYVGVGISARLDDPGLGYGLVTRNQVYLKAVDGTASVSVGTDNGKIPVPMQTLTVSTVFGSGYSEGDLKSLYITCDAGMVRYNYQWVSDPAPTVTPSPTPIPITVLPTSSAATDHTIILTGLVMSMDSKPMCRMEITTKVFYDADNQTVSRVIHATTDLGGRLRVEIPLPKGLNTKVGLQVEGHFDCSLKSGEKTFHLTSREVPDSNTKESVWVASFITVDPNAPEYKDVQIISLQRQFVYSHLGLDPGYWSSPMGDGSEQVDPMITSGHPVKQIQDYSYLYATAWDALVVGGALLKELDSIRNTDLIIELSWNKDKLLDRHGKDGSFYEGGANTIRLVEAESKMDDMSRFVILHEFGHFFDYKTNQDNFRTASLLPHDPGDINHGGYLNTTTSDSCLEGFASFYAMMVQAYRKEKVPNLVHGYPLNIGDRIAWDSKFASSEEFAIAALLYHSMFFYENILDYWKILDVDRKGFFEYYSAIEKSLPSPAYKAMLREYALAGGLYKMPFGNGQYDPGEPFRDNPGTSAYNIQSDGTITLKPDYQPVYDAGELYGDLMFNTYANGIVEDSPLQEYRKEALEAGKSTDFSRQSRESVALQQNCFLALQGEPVEFLLVRILPDGQQGVQSLFATTDRGVYIGLPAKELSGKVEVAVPGGQVIYQNDLAVLYKRMLETAGQRVPLDTAAIPASALPSGYFTIPMPTGGDIEASGVFKIEQMTYQDFSARMEGYDPEASLETLSVSDDWRTDASTQSPAAVSAHGAGFLSRVKPVILLAICFLAGICIAIPVILIRRKRRTAAPAANTAASKLRYCRHCGSQNGAKASFCRSCGKPLQ